jgi:membrane peptidoglycan carboxypeptidase
VLVVVVAVVYEVKTSVVQSWVFSQLSKRLTYTVAAGPSPNIVFPKSGPFDQRLGYTRLSDFQKRLESASYRVTEQARFSPDLARLANWGISPPYREPAVAGLTIRSAQGNLIYRAADSELQFHTFEQVPPIVVNALLAMENRELGEPTDIRRNPVVEWDRLAKASLTYAGSKLGLPLRVEGGSTLATQIEKYRHSTRGRTDSPVNKVQQILGASLKVYRTGVDTRAQRHEIILEYLNTMPLSAAPGFGEVHGLGQGLLAWYGLNLEEVRFELSSDAVSEQQRAKAFKHVLSLLASVRAPTNYLIHDRAALEQRTNYYAGYLATAGIVANSFATLVEATPLAFAESAAVSLKLPTPQQKTANAIRNNLARLLGVPSYYDLDRLHLNVATTIDTELQDRMLEIFRKLKDPQFLSANGLRGERLLSQGDPENVLYSLLLFERTPTGNALRVQLDSLDRFFDVNEGMKLELGSTAKLRTLAHYLETVAGLHDGLSRLDRKSLGSEVRKAKDPITRWAAETMAGDRSISLEGLVQRALDRSYSASPGELFFTGGGAHVFHNFDREDNGQRLTLREATLRSTNLVYIRLMRDLVRFHQARLPYDVEAVMSDPKNPVRRQMLSEIASGESRFFLYRAYDKFKGLSGLDMVSRLLGRKASDPRRLAILFYAWHRGAGTTADEQALKNWIDRFGSVPRNGVSRLIKAYGNPRLTLADYAYLLDLHPLDVWCAGEVLTNPQASWEDLYSRSGEAQKAASSWLFKTRNRRAQDLRLRIRVEQDAFVRMTPYWQQHGFPFERLVPSLATAIGNSSDRPSALSELMGIILNDGMRRPTVRMTDLEFARGTPYVTRLQPVPEPGERAMAAPVARALRDVLNGVVERGTARRVAGAFKLPDGTVVPAGGKTGSGDNEYKAISRGGGVISSRQVNRTATFVFYIGDRYFGVLTAFVDGPQAARYKFTSALPVSILKLLSPALNTRLADAKGAKPAPITHGT